MNKKIKIGNKIISKDSPAFIVAEISANHNGDYNRAVETIHAAADAGADAVKLQTYTADTITMASMGTTIAISVLTGVQYAFSLLPQPCLPIL